MSKVFRTWSLGKFALLYSIILVNNQEQTYECKKERTYKVRPTRTQQLKKPIKLYEPELPKELQEGHGLADRILKKKEKERISKRKRARQKYNITMTCIM